MASYGSPWKGNRRDPLDELWVGVNGNVRDLVGQWMEGRVLKEMTGKGDISGSRRKVVDGGLREGMRVEQGGETTVVI